MKLKKILPFLAAILYSPTLIASYVMSPDDVDFAQRALWVIEERNVGTEELQNPGDFAKEVKNAVNFSWETHEDVVRNVAEGLRAGDRDIEDITARLRDLRSVPGDDDIQEIDDALVTAPRVIFCLPPMNGLNVFCALKYIQDFMERNASINIFVVNAYTSTKIDDYNEVAWLVKALNLNISSVPMELPENSLLMYLWATPEIIKNSSPLTVIDSKGSNTSKSMAAFKKACAEIQYVLFACSPEHGMLNKERFFPDDESVHLVVPKPSKYLQDTFYGKPYAEGEDLELELSFVMETLTNMQRKSVALSSLLAKRDDA